MPDLEAIRKQWLEERHIYEEFAVYVAAKLRAMLRDEGVISIVQHRCKDVASLLKKVMRENYSDYERITDKAGVRVVVKYLSSLADAEALIARNFNVRKADDKLKGLAVDQLGYSGRHYDIQLFDDSEQAEFSGKVCEIQLQTKAQNLWSDTSHELLYKPAQDTPAHLRRRINRLVAVMEIFDDEVDGVRKVVSELPDADEARLLALLEVEFFKLTSRSFDAALSLQILSVLKSQFDATGSTAFAKRLTDFVAAEKDKLQEIYRIYADDDRASALLFQPEAIAIFCLLEADQYKLKELWEQSLPITMLDELATVWGVQLGLE